MSEEVRGLDENVKRALKVLIDAEKNGDELTLRDVLERLGMTQQEYMIIDQYLAQKECIGWEGGGLDGCRFIKGGGIDLYRELTKPSPNLQIGAQIYGNVQNSAIQAVAGSVNTNIQQIVQQTAPEDVRDELCKVIEAMVQAVKDKLTVEELASYAQVAADFRQEVLKEDPNKSRLHRWFSRLTYLGDIESTIQFGERALKLANHLGPYIPIALEYLNRL